MLRARLRVVTGGLAVCTALAGLPRSAAALEDVAFALKGEDVRFVGRDGSDQAGSAVAVGDVSGDGIGDILVGVPNSRGPENRRDKAGEVALVLGAVDLQGPSGSTLDEVLAQPKRLGLLAYLALARPHGYQRTDPLLALFWPDLDTAHARAALRQSVYFLRRHLGAGALLSRGRGEEVSVASDLWCDAVAFEAALDEGRPEDALELARGARIVVDAVAIEHQRAGRGEVGAEAHRAQEPVLHVPQRNAVRRGPVADGCRLAASPDHGRDAVTRRRAHERLG